jgi:hypothetical protein
MTPLEGNMAGALKPVDVSTKRQRIAKLARQNPEMGFMPISGIRSSVGYETVYRHVART